MNKKDITEIRKIMKKENTPVDWIYSFYVTPDNELVWQSLRKFISFNEDEVFRYTEILKKSLAGTIGKELFSAGLASQPEELLAIRSSDSPSEESLEAFAGDIMASYAHTDPYFACLARITYDVPARASDGRALEDGDMVYQALLFTICPAALSKPALGYDDVSGVSELGRRWTVGTPSEGFLYPSFHERATDANEVFYRSKKSISKGLFDAFFEADVPVAAQEQKEAFASLMDALNIGMEEAAGIQEDLAQLEAEGVSELEAGDIKKLAERCGIDTEGFDSAYTETVGDIPLTVSAIRDPAVVISTGSAVIKIPADRSQFVKTRMIDGVSYITVPVDGVVIVNGIPASVCTEHA